MKSFEKRGLLRAAILSTGGRDRHLAMGQAKIAANATRRVSGNRSLVSSTLKTSNKNVRRSKLDDFLLSGAKKKAIRKWPGQGSSSQGMDKPGYVVWKFRGPGVSVWLAVNQRFQASGHIGVRWA